MKSFTFITILSILLSINGLAQKDPAADPYLNQFSKNALEAPAVRMCFDLIITDQVENTTETRIGEIVIKNDLYWLSLPENIIWHNKEAIWTLAPEVDEVTITEPDPDGETFFNSPSSLFTLYKKGYKYSLVGETSCAVTIDLYPEDLMAEFSRIRLVIGDDYRLISAEYKRKDGMDMLIKVKVYDLTSAFDNNYFTFSHSKYPNVDIIDMR
jgi:outer membrane lipoprotein-sorting protein